MTAVDGATVRRSSYVPAEITGGIFVEAADPELLGTLEGTTASGRFVDRATERYPAIVLGAKAAKRLGIRGVDGIVQVYVSGRLFTVVGILDPLPLVPELDSAALIGYPVAARLFGTDRNPSTIYVRAREGEAQVRAAAALLPSAADPWDPEEVAVSRPSDALEAQAAAEGAFTSLFLGLGAVALLVGAIGIANVMIISVLERRSEVGLRRALGARRRHIAVQFLGESFVLGIAGGVVGVLLGAGATGVYAAYEGLTLLVPPAAVAGGLARRLPARRPRRPLSGDARRPPHPDRSPAHRLTMVRPTEFALSATLDSTAAHPPPAKEQDMAEKSLSPPRSTSRSPTSSPPRSSTSAPPSTTTPRPCPASPPSSTARRWRSASTR